MILSHPLGICNIFLSRVYIYSILFWNQGDSLPPAHCLVQIWEGCWPLWDRPFAYIFFNLPFQPLTLQPENFSQWYDIPTAPLKALYRTLHIVG